MTSNTEGYTPLFTANLRAERREPEIEVAVSRTILANSTIIYHANIMYQTLCQASKGQDRDGKHDPWPKQCTVCCSPWFCEIYMLKFSLLCSGSTSNSDVFLTVQFPAVCLHIH